MIKRHLSPKKMPDKVRRAWSKMFDPLWEFLRIAGEQGIPDDVIYSLIFRILITEANLHFMVKFGQARELEGGENE